jgi:peptidoglycan/xylan/chitin deacetylase (PgdA/CDA1 family)
MEQSQRSVYLTFDDGPIPEATPYVLDVLDSLDIKATFFMVGDNACRYPHLLEEVRRRGHRIGNHTFNHISGFRWQSETYIGNVQKAEEILQTSQLFRPPHGWMNPMQYHIMLSMGWRIVMWDLVTRDYSTRLNGRDVLLNVRRYARPGSIITFHDSLKSHDKILYALPRAIEWLLSQGYTFKVFD